MYRPKVVLSPELTASSAAALGRVVQSPHFQRGVAGTPPVLLGAGDD